MRCLGNENRYRHSIFINEAEQKYGTYHETCGLWTVCAGTQFGHFVAILNDFANEPKNTQFLRLPNRYTYW